MRLKASIAILLLLLGCARAAETPLIGLEYGSKEYENKNLVLLDTCIGRLTDCSGNLLTSSVQPQTMPCAALGVPPDGTVYYCPDCTLGSIPCTCGGTGTLAVRLAGAWACGTGGAALVLPGFDTQVLYNDGGALGADSGLTFNETTNVLTAGGFVGPLAGNVTGNLTGSVTGGTVTGVLRDAGGAVYNVKAPPYNATGDGSTDDTAAIQAAITAAAAANGGTVYIPSGTYVVTDVSPVDSIALKVGQTANIAIVGAGRNATKLRYAGTTALDVIRFGPASGTTPVSGSVEGLQISFTGANHLSTGIHFIDPTYCHVRNVGVGATPGANNKIKGLDFDVQTTGLVPPGGTCHVEDYLYTQLAGSTAAGSRGIRAISTATEEIRNIIIDGWGNIEDAEVGVELNHAFHSFLGDYFMHGNTTGVKLTNAQGNMIQRTNFASNTTEHINISADSYDTTIVAPSFFNPLVIGTDLGIRTVRIGGGTSGFVTSTGPWLDTGTSGSALANVMAPQYGAKCDGTTNDLNAIGLAIASGACAFIPPTTSGCSVSGTLVLSDNQCIIGWGTRSKLVEKTNSTPLIQIEGSNTRVDNLMLTKGAGVTASEMVRVNNVAGSFQVNYNHLSRLRIEGTGTGAGLLGAGIYIQAGTTVSGGAGCAGQDCGAFYNKITDTEIRYAVDGVVLTGTATHLTNGANGTQVDNLRIGDSTTAFRIDRADTARVVNLAIEGCTTGILISDSAGADNNANQFTNLRFEANTSDVTVSANSFQNQFVVAAPVTAKWTIDATSLPSTSIYSATALWRSPWGNFKDTDGILYLDPSNSTQSLKPLTLKSTLRDPDTPVANRVGFGFSGNLTSGQCAGAACYFAIKAPNASFGPPLSLFADSVGKALDFRSQFFDSSTNTGSGCSFSANGTTATVTCANAGTSAAIPFEFSRTFKASPDPTSNVACAAGTNGTLFFDSDINKLCYCKGASSTYCTVGDNGAGNAETCGNATSCN